MASKTEQEHPKLTTLQEVVENYWEESDLVVDERTAEERLQAGLRIVPELIAAIEDFASVLDSCIPHDSKIYEPDGRRPQLQRLAMSKASRDLIDAVEKFRVRDRDGAESTIGRNGNSIAFIQMHCRRASRKHRTTAEGSPAWWADQYQMVMETSLYAEAHNVHSVVRDLQNRLPTVGVPEDTPNRLRVLATRLRRAVDSTIEQMHEAGLTPAKRIAMPAPDGLSSAELRSRAGDCCQDVLRSVTRQVGLRGRKKGEKFNIADLRRIALSQLDLTPSEQLVVDEVRKYLKEVGIDLTKAMKR